MPWTAMMIFFMGANPQLGMGSCVGRKGSYLYKRNFPGVSVAVRKSDQQTNKNRRRGAAPRGEIPHRKYYPEGLWIGQGRRLEAGRHLGRSSSRSSLSKAFRSSWLRVWMFALRTASFSNCLTWTRWSELSTPGGRRFALF